MKYLNERNIEINHTIKLNLPSNINEVQLFFSLPTEHYNQKNIIIKSISPPPTEIFELDGNEVVFIKCKVSTNVTIAYELTLLETLLGRGIDLMNPTEPEYKKYTKSQQLIQINDKTKELAQNIIQNEKEPIKQVKMIYTWIIENISYKKPQNNFGNLSALRMKKGDCGDMSFIFVSLCRSLNIPARVVFGWWAIAPGKTGSHAWAECFIEEFGWIPVDCSISSLIKKAKRTLGLFSGIDYYGLSRNENYYFGNLDNKRVIYSLGSEFEAPYSYPDFLTEYYEKLKMDINGNDYIWGKISKSNKILWLHPFFIHFERENENDLVYPSIKSKFSIVSSANEKILYISHILSGILLFPAIIFFLFFHNSLFVLLSLFIHSSSGQLVWKGTTRLFYLFILILSLFMTTIGFI